MNKTMLIDASYQDEVRVAVVNENAELENFEIESKIKLNTKGNIYIAKVLRIEPSLQAVFVDYGNERQGFLSFSNIHPNYYQHDIKNETEKTSIDENNDFANLENAIAESKEMLNHTQIDEKDNEFLPNENEEHDIDDVNKDEENELQELTANQTEYKKYKVQDVIKSKQLLLVQVVKEERGNKCAALTTYISLAGRYCILMPNSGNKNAISKKITNKKTRERIKKNLEEINTNSDCNVVVRSAGEKKTKSDIKKDYDFLTKLWNDITKVFGKIKHPYLVHKESCLIKRSLRDLYSKDVKDIFVAGEESYKIAKDFMATLIPSHARRVKQYKESSPLFNKYGIAQQVDSAYSTRVPLPSGGYIIINPTEALISIDVNSGKATKEKDIEETALSTNLEAAKEITKQIMIRNMSGIIIIDFIDMVSNANNIFVEKTFKSFFKHDKAKVQISKMSKLGLIEISRQRLRPSMVETFFSCCPLCDGFGLVNDVNFASLRIMRAINDHSVKNNSQENIIVKVHQEILNHIFNNYKRKIIEIEESFNKRIQIIAENSVSINGYIIESHGIENKNNTNHKKPKKNHQKKPVKNDPPQKTITEDLNKSKNQNQKNKPIKKESPKEKNQTKNQNQKSFSIAKPTVNIIEEIYDSNNPQPLNPAVNANTDKAPQATTQNNKPKKKRTRKKNNVTKIEIVDTQNAPHNENSVIKEEKHFSKNNKKPKKNKTENTNENNVEVETTENKTLPPKKKITPRKPSHRKEKKIAQENIVKTETPSLTNIKQEETKPQSNNDENTNSSKKEGWWNKLIKR